MRRLTSLLSISETRSPGGRALALVVSLPPFCVVFAVPSLSPSPSLHRK